MSIKSSLSKQYAGLIQASVKKWSKTPYHSQNKVFDNLILKAKNTKFGRDHGFENISTYEDFKKAVPIRDYEELSEYIALAKKGDNDILWPGKPIYFCKTSGTTSGAKYIPITIQSLPNHIHSARNALLNYIAESQDTRFVNGKMIFIQGSPILEAVNGISFGRLSGIVAHHVPAYLKNNRMPSYDTNCIEDWEKKVDAIVEETINENMTLVSGIPAWVQMYFEKLHQKSGGKLIKDIFPNFSLLVFGGVNFEPYRKRFEQLIGKSIPSIELYPTSEGFIAFQDSQTEEGLLLILNQGIFYEFIKADEFYNENPQRISLTDVELGVNYVLILNTNAGLWGYNIGDTIKFVSKNPHRIIVTGRIKHFTSAFGEHVIAEEVEYAIQEAINAQNAQIVEFTVAPQVNPKDGELPYHEWFIEFAEKPKDMDAFRKTIDLALKSKNTYYADLLKGSVLQPLKVSCVTKDGFNRFMKIRGKLGGQNKIPRLSNDRKIADELGNFIET